MQIGIKKIAALYTHASLEGRVKRVTDKPLILINNYIGDPKLDTLFNQLTAEHKH
ncbi:hypothetical protein ACGLRO_001570 [Escherichia coli]